MSDTRPAFVQCPYCGLIPHINVAACPAVQAVEYYPDGTIKRIEKVVPKRVVFGNPAVD